MTEKTYILCSDCAFMGSPLMDTDDHKCLNDESPVLRTKPTASCQWSKRNNTEKDTDTDKDTCEIDSSIKVSSMIGTMIASGAEILKEHPGKKVKLSVCMTTLDVSQQLSLVIGIETDSPFDGMEGQPTSKDA